LEEEKESNSSSEAMTLHFASSPPRNRSDTPVRNESPVLFSSPSPEKQDAGGDENSDSDDYDIDLPPSMLLLSRDIQSDDSNDQTTGFFHDKMTDITSSDRGGVVGRLKSFVSLKEEEDSVLNEYLSRYSAPLGIYRLTFWRHAFEFTSLCLRFGRRFE